MTTPARRRTAYTARHVVTRPPEPAAHDLVVLVDGDRIAGVVGRAEVPAEYEVVDLGAGWLAPGMIDLHVHLVWSGGVEPAGRREAETEVARALHASRRGLAHLAAGVTTVRDVAGDSPVVFGLREAIASGDLVGPRIIASGRPIVMTGGHGWELGLIADGPEEVRRMTRRNIADGADLIKVMATGGVFPVGEHQGSVQYGPDELAAAVDVAHNAGKRVAAHAQGLAGVRNAVRAGVDTLEHGSYLDAATAAEAAAAGQTLVPTLVAFQRYGDLGTASGLPAHPVEKAADVLANGILAVGYALDAGLRVAAGTDAGGRAKPHGCLVWELELLRDAGLGRPETFAAATTHAAAACGRSDLGTLATGAYADLIGVAGDPYEIRPLHDVTTVVAGGRPVKVGGRLGPLDLLAPPGARPLPPREEATDIAALAI